MKNHGEGKMKERVVDKSYCISSFLSFRYIANPLYAWRDDIVPRTIHFVSEEEKTACVTAADIDRSIMEQLEDLDFTRMALLLSGGIDSGILASYLPPGSVAYTVSNPSVKSNTEIERAARVCDSLNLQHRIVEITWNDYLEGIDTLMRHDGCPVFANEPQVYALAKRIMADGFDTILFGDNADMAFGGMDQMLSKDWTFDEWVERYTFIKPESVLTHPANVQDVYEKYRTGKNSVDYLKFIDEVFAASSSGAYINAFDCLGMRYIDPYARMKMKEPLDLQRVRSGDSKYMLRELYRLKFPGFNVPDKIAMARGVDTWLKNWEGPRRQEFQRNCFHNLTGEQKFMIYSLERFLEIMDL